MGQWSTLVTPALGSREGKIQGTLSWLSLSVSPMSQGKSCLKNKLFSSSEMTPEVGPWSLHACVCVCAFVCTHTHTHTHTHRHTRTHAHTREHTHTNMHTQEPALGLHCFCFLNMDLRFNSTCVHSICFNLPSTVFRELLHPHVHFHV